MCSKQTPFSHPCPASREECFQPELHSLSPKEVPRRTNSVQIGLNLLSEEGETLPMSPKQHNQIRKESCPCPSPFLVRSIHQHTCNDTHVSSCGDKAALQFHELLALAWNQSCGGEVAFRSLTQRQQIEVTVM